MPSKLIHLAVLTSCLSLAACTGTRPASLGNEKSSLQPCPESPNCVSSVAQPDDSQHFIKAIDTQGIDAPMAALEGIIETSGGRIIHRAPHYIYAEFTSDILRFVDDVEFLLIADEQKIDVRSASRLGHSDFSVNRERIENIRNEFKR